MALALALHFGRPADQLWTSAWQCIRIGTVPDWRTGWADLTGAWLRRRGQLGHDRFHGKPASPVTVTRWWGRVCRTRTTSPWRTRTSRRRGMSSSSAVLFIPSTRAAGHDGQVLLQEVTTSSCTCAASSSRTTSRTSSPSASAPVYSTWQRTSRQHHSRHTKCEQRNPPCYVVRASSSSGVQSQLRRVANISCPCTHYM